MTTASDIGGNPYARLPDYCFWKQSVSFAHPDAIDPVVKSDLQINGADKIASLGSCFAQNISKHLQESGLHYLVTEPSHPLFSSSLARKFNYGIYTVRCGNIYTPRQLLQLVERAYDLEYSLADRFWINKRGEIVDPFRPQIQPGGFSCKEEFVGDREQHLSAVRRMVEDCSVLIFTLGLTEAWMSTLNGEVYPVCPGVIQGDAGTVDYKSHNFTIDEMRADLIELCELLKQKNPQVRILLTVSPVPLVATFEDRSVVLSTSYSKCVLRVAAQIASDMLSHVFYFPSFEVITSSYTRGSYFAEDFRTITQSGIERVMHLFSKHFLSPLQEAPAGSTQASGSEFSRQMDLVGEAANIVCDEEVHGRNESGSKT